MNKVVFRNADWPAQAASVIAERIEKILLEKQNCSIFLTGGRSAAAVYPFLAEHIRDFKGEIHFYIGDERCVPEDHQDSNYGMIINKLFSGGFNSNQKLYKMYDSIDGPQESLIKYAGIVPDKADLIILGLGDDGHIASLFPGQSWINQNNMKIISAISPYNGLERLTITQYVIERADQIIILASGTNKSRILSQLYNNLNDLTAIPARMLIKGLWLFDQNAIMNTGLV
jgi:6-phosphogluconolactonase